LLQLDRVLFDEGGQLRCDFFRGHARQYETNLSSL
jgi:hypothetical protein